MKTDGHVLKFNFITSNTYACIELNAHALIQAIRKFRDSEEPELFLVWLFSSQPCEEFYATLRSMTSTFSTIVNFSILECQQRVRRADYICDSQFNLKDTIIFPRAQRKTKKATASPVFYPTLPEDYEIEYAVLDSFSRAKKRAIAFGMASASVKVPECFLPHVPMSDLAKEKSPTPSYEEDLSDEEELVADDSDNVEEATHDQEQDDAVEDLLVVSTGSLGLRSYSNVEVTESSPFVNVSDANGKPAAIRKSSYLYLCDGGDLEGVLKLSSDRLLRVMQSKKTPQKTSLPTCHDLSVPHKEEFVAIGDWCAFKSEDKSIAVGRIEAFRYLKGDTWKKQEYSELSAPTTPPTRNARGLGVLCSWYSINKSKMLIPTSMDIHGFYNISNYICTLPRPSGSLADKTLTVAWTEKQISSYLKTGKI